ncbi:unnamed protein product [Sympodiomycopsis kandeliae]
MTEKANSEKAQLRVLDEQELWAITPKAFVEDESRDLGRNESQKVAYLQGLRGLLAIEVLLFTFFRLLMPAVASDTDLDGTYPAAFSSDAPAWQNGLRRGLSPLLWDSTLPSAFFVILSARVVSLTFLERRNSISIAGATFRRPVRLVLPVLAALAFTSIVSVAGGFKYAAQFAELTQNTMAQPPQIWKSTIEFVNSAVSLFFNTQPSKTDRAVAFLPPADTAWVIPVIFQQSFTAYVFSILLPYATLSSKLWGFAGFIIVTYWLGSWAWYTLTGLQIAEFTTCYLGSLPALGIPLDRFGKRHLPTWSMPSVFLLLGVVLKYVMASEPSRRNDEYVFHARRSDGSLNRGLNPAVTPYPRIDDYLLVTGAMVLLELSPVAQRNFSNTVLRFLGRISFVLYLTCGTICLSLGSFLYIHLVETQHWTNQSQIGAVLFFTCIPLSLLTATVAYYAVEKPTQWFARISFDFMHKD